ncbi:hypothetical protein SAMN02745857_03830 [Andreprevotia lacus DSM 23236]|jgi:hypothetical protein|uniref:Uncharacterized protein n=1 Tax=Andreprevotia lacus DSM 23236 TaxID=1121001 RepID=A0A1W1XZW8_9NEIS|nr:hypothetical protein [Andreprevotia lacus]SMC29432.1 hypothetical protein SAMN02745857_03830 [Andreprevotia lacus DSM 23236]
MIAWVEGLLWGLRVFAVLGLLFCLYLVVRPRRLSRRSAVQGVMSVATAVIVLCQEPWPVVSWGALAIGLAATLWLLLRYARLYPRWRRRRQRALRA